MASCVAVVFEPRVVALEPVAYESRPHVSAEPSLGGATSVNVRAKVSAGESAIAQTSARASSGIAIMPAPIKIADVESKPVVKVLNIFVLLFCGHANGPD